MNNCLKYDDNNKHKIIDEITSNLDQNLNCQYIIKYIHPDYLKLSTNQFISIAQSLDYESVINSLDFIEDLNNIKIWDCVLDSCHKQSFIDSKLINFFHKANQEDIFNYFESQLLNPASSIDKKIFSGVFLYFIDLII